MADALDKKAWWMEQVTTSLQKAGKSPDTGAIQRDLGRMLEQMDRLASKSRGKKTAPKESLKPHALAAEAGATFFKRPIPSGPDRTFGLVVAGVEAEKMLMLGVRLQELSRRHPTVRSKAGIDEQDYVYPEFGRAVAEEWSWYMLRQGKYKGLSDRDRERCWWRACEDIADRSNALPGMRPWWVR